MELPNTSSQAVELNPSCLGQAHPNTPGTGLGQKNMEPGRIFTVLHIPFMICPLSADAKSGKVVQKILCSWHKWACRSWQASEDPQKTIQESRDPRWAKESVTPSQQSSAGWMPESMGRWFVGVGCRHPVTMHKASFKTLSMR